MTRIILMAAILGLTVSASAACDFTKTTEADQVDGTRVASIPLPEPVPAPQTDSSTTTTTTTPPPVEKPAK